MRWLRFLQCLYILPRCGAFPCFFTALLHCLVTDLANQTCSCFSCKNFHLRGASQRWEREEASHRLERGEVPLIGGIDDVEPLKVFQLFQHSDSTGGLSPLR